MIATRHIVELVAKVPVTVIEVAMENEFNEGDGQNNRHTAREEGLPILLRG